jgi:hypothetical protein
MFQIKEDSINNGKIYYAECTYDHLHLRLLVGVRNWSAW